MRSYEELYRMNKKEKFYFEDQIDALCYKFKVHKDIVESYLNFFLIPNGHYHSNLMCGTGKTMGLAIAVACSQTRIIYIANNHERLDDFENKLKACRLGFKSVYHVRSSEELSREIISTHRVILMTSSMLLQVTPYKYTENGDKLWQSRVMVMDEFPNLIHKFSYNRSDALFLKNFCVLRALGTESNFESIKYDFNLLEFSNPSYLALSRFFEENILESDLAINNPKITNEENRLVNDYKSKMFLVNYLLNSDSLLNDTISEYYFTIEEIYYARFPKTLTLDATAELYKDILKTTHYSLGNEDEYNKYIQSSFKVNSLNKSLEAFTDKQFRTKNFVWLLKLLQNTFNELNDGAIYVVTNNDCIYDSNDEIKENVLEYLKSIYKVIHKEPNKNFILCTNREIDLDNIDKDSITNENGDLFIANYNRNRGTNIFRNCKYVFLLGEFRLPENELEELVKLKFPDVSSSSLSFNLSVADAVQELSRGCLRTRDLENKESIFLLGKEDWINGIFKFMKIKENIFDLKLGSESNILDYLLMNSDNSRKSSYCYLCNLILNYNFKLPYSAILKEIEKGNLPELMKKWNKLVSYFVEIGIDDPNEVLVWD